MSQPRPMIGRTCLVTGATRGIGRVTAVELARLGADVVIVGRDAGRAEAAAAQARAAAGAAGGKVEVLVGDLSCMGEVRRVASEFLATHDRLDVLVNNAGAIFERREVTRDGLEMTFALNHMAYFLLTDMLLATLRRSAPARIVNVASGAHRSARLDLADPMMSRRYSGWRQYCNSKLCNILYTRELARRLEGTGVTVNAVHPGVVATNFGRDRLGFFALLVSLLRPTMISEERGADTLIHLASAPEVADRTGEYWVERQAVVPTNQALDDDLARRLWQLSEQLAAGSA